MCLSCSGSRIINSIEVSELLLIVSEQQSINYSHLLNEAVNGEEVAVCQLALLDIYDCAGYEHGIVIVDLIVLIGEEHLSSHSRELSQKKKRFFNNNSWTRCVATKIFT